MDDLRRPTGILFGLLGAILTAYALAEPGVSAPLDPPVNVNLYCGIVLLVFGGCLLWLSLRKTS